MLATATTDLADHLRGLGTDTIIDFASASTPVLVAAAHPEGIDAVIDLITPGGGDPAPMIGLLRPDGTIVSTNGDATGVLNKAALVGGRRNQKQVGSE